MAGKSLAIFLDGTWNKPSSRTNVWRLYDQLNITPSVQGYKGFYGEGVGSSIWERVSGGAFARGLSQDVCNAYQWLAGEYAEGDSIFIFGFSRGAFTARSLAGMIARCGLLVNNTQTNIETLFDRYDSPKEHTPLHELIYQQDYVNKSDFSESDKWLLDNSRRVDIQFLGLWDTVGTVGVPIGNIRGFSRKQFMFHHTRWSTLYKNFAHALALDEERKDYLPVMLYDYIPEQEKPDISIANLQNYTNSVEQRWFPGVHASIGGGYEDQTLAALPYRWILQKARNAGLQIVNVPDVNGIEYKGELVDSYSEFLFGAYKYIPGIKRIRREIGAAPREVTGGRIAAVNETIDVSVFKRWQDMPSYRPNNLRSYLAREQIDPDSIKVHLSISLAKYL